MAAIDIIENMSNHELVKYYKYCMDHRFYELRHKGVSYHPSYEHCKVYVGENKINRLHHSNEEFLLNEMWQRFLSDNFFNQCWWKTQKIFQTNIDFPSTFETIAQRRIHEKVVSKKTDTEKFILDNEIFEFIGSGTKRKVFLSPCKTYVIKVPLEPTALGLLENRTEAEIYKSNPNGIYAYCYLMENGLLKMEYVEPAFFKKGDNYPEWTLNIAEHQVGYNLQGVLVAYDYGSTI
jgi:hypothetical protein